MTINHVSGEDDVTFAGVLVVGAGLAGCECALSLAQRGIPVRLYEMRPHTMTAAHHTSLPAELVCSNSFKATRIDSCAGLLKEELHRLGSNLLPLAESNAVPAGGALAVDRNAFSCAVRDLIYAHPLIELINEEVTSIPSTGIVVIAAGPLCSQKLTDDIQAKLGSCLSFFDAAAPIVDASTLSYESIFAQSRYGRGYGDDYLNCPMDKSTYECFINELISAERVVLKEFESHDLFQACQPVEEIARKGLDALRFGALKPVGITDPKTGKRPWAVVQLRAENCEGSAYNLVGFQTNLTFSEQARVFRMIPGLETAEFFRYGVMHRNTFIDSPHVLDRHFAFDNARVIFAGQITGTEGYTEAIASGLYAAMNIYAQLRNTELDPLPTTTALGSLIAYATNPKTTSYQPMHVNYGLIPVLQGSIKLSKRDKYAAYSKRALQDLDAWIMKFATDAGMTV